MKKLPCSRILKVLFVFWACWMPFCAFASDWKVVDKSEKKLPDWLKTHNPETLLITVESPSLEEAREKAVSLIQLQIVQAVATHVDYSINQHSTENIVNGDANSNETIEAQTRVIAAKLPFIDGVSLSQATAIYWEKLENKKTKSVEYRLSVLYPLPESELQAMRSQYKKEDADKQQRLETLAAGINDVHSMAEVQTALVELKELQEYFPDATRREEAMRVFKDYNSITSRVMVQAEQTGPGFCKVRITYNGTPFNAGGKITVKSECANRFKVSPAENGCDWDITFSTEDCLDTEENFLEISFRGKGIKKDIRLTINI